MRACLHHIALGAAIPYGYTVLTAASGGMLIRRHGPPSLAAGLLFVLGATLAFLAVSTAAKPGTGDYHQRAVTAGAVSGVAAALGVLSAGALVAEVPGTGAFGVVAFATTLVYLSAEATGLWMARRHA